MHHITIKLDHPSTQPGKIEGFQAIWAYYVTGYNQNTHCKACFRGKPSAKIKTDTAQSHQLYVMDERPSFKYLYLCGVALARDLRHIRNVHLPLRYASGHTETHQTYNGYIIQIQNAESLPIPALEPGFQGLPERHYRCKNFQFGVAYFGWQPR